ncbi:MAG: MBL fold metallo-hydrolase [Egibacteraceae bacterium]
MPETADRLEVILFGPGYGECALISLGSGTWMIVDSCLEDGRQPALEHLRAIGAEPATDVRLVVATHWHDDHVAGLSAVVETCSTADFVCSTALGSDEFLALVDLDARSGDQRRAVRELGVVFALLEDRGVIPRWASADRPLWRGTGAPDDGTLDAEVVALAPSDATFTRSLHAFQRLLREQGAPVRPRVRAVSPNLSSVVVWVRVGTDMAIFGGDLEARADRSIGWGAVVDSTTRPTGRATLYKVAHHGSPNADAAEIWDKLLAAAPTATLAPFTHGRVVRPDAEDVQRICGRAGALHLTAPAEPPGRVSRPPAVQRLVDEVAVALRRLEPPLGSVRLVPATGTAPYWDAHLTGGAFTACGGGTDPS